MPIAALVAAGLVVLLLVLRPDLGRGYYATYERNVHEAQTPRPPAREALAAGAGVRPSDDIELDVEDPPIRVRRQP